MIQAQLLLKEQLIIVVTVHIIKAKYMNQCLQKNIPHEYNSNWKLKHNILQHCLQT